MILLLLHWNMGNKTTYCTFQIAYNTTFNELLYNHRYKYCYMNIYIYLSNSVKLEQYY